MGNSDLSNDVTSASTSLIQAMVAFDDVAKRVERAYRELKEKEEAAKIRDELIIRKNRELVDREAKLKKREDDVRMREVMVAEKEERYSVMESKVSEHAARFPSKIQINVGMSFLSLLFYQKKIKYIKI